MLSSSLDINLGTVYQLIRTLQSNGYVNRLPGGRYQLGPRIGFLLDHYDLRTAPPQPSWTACTNCTSAPKRPSTSRSSRDPRSPSSHHAEGTRRLRVGNAVVGYSAYPHARASGKAFLAFCDPDHLDDYFDNRTLERLTDNTITDWDDLLTELEEIRTTGLAYDSEEFDEGIACIAAVIVGPDGDAIGSYSAALPTARLERRRDTVAVAITKAAEDAS